MTEENKPTSDLKGLTSGIVSAFAAGNKVAHTELSGLIHSVHNALATLGIVKPEKPVEDVSPAVSVRASVRPDYIVCLECGKKQSMLKRHLASAHGLTPVEYKAKYQLKADYPLVAANYATKRRDLAHAIGLGRKKKVAAPAAATPAKTTRGRKPKAEPAAAPARKPRASKPAPKAAN